MGVVIFKTKFSDFSSENTLRNDFKYNSFLNHGGWNLFKSNSVKLIPLKDILVPFYEFCEFEDGIEYFGIPTGKAYLDQFGEIILTQLVTKEEHPNRLKYKIDSDCILISSLKGARIPALSFDFDLSEYVFSNGFYVFKINKSWSKIFVLYLLRSAKIKNIIDNSIYRGIGISTYREEDLLKILIPKIDYQKQLEIVRLIQPIEKEITNLKNSKLKTLDIINKVFGDFFDISLDFIDELEKTNKISVKLSSVSTNNVNVRNGMRWNKMQFIQSELYEKIDCIKVLGNYIKATKNGWSPLSVEDGEGTPILGQEHFAFDGKLKIEASKFSEESRNNIEDFYIKQGDFFVSRGNTVDLVALASIVQDEIIDDILFPDLYIKIDFDETNLNKEYIAYLFNSFFGRLYFKYVAKGKNQTMVKISAIELLNFRFPLPNKTQQTQIVEKIKMQLDAQNIIDQQIEQKQQEISEIIENTLI